MYCNEKFGVFRRKHHCRSCGNVFCSACTPHFTKIQALNESDGSRVCIECFQKLSKVLEPNSIASGNNLSPIESDLLSQQQKTISDGANTLRRFESMQQPKYARAYRYVTFLYTLMYR